MASSHTESTQAKSTPPSRTFRSFYGAGPLHLVVLLAALALTAYTLSVIGLTALWDPEVWWQSILVWFLGAVIAHDLIVFPLYTAVDRVLCRTARRSRATQNKPHGQHPSQEQSVLNYVRIPLKTVAFLFVLFFPGILGQGADTYLDATGQTQDPFLRRWLLLSASILAVSAAVYALRRFLVRRRVDPHGSAASSPSMPPGPETR